MNLVGLVSVILDGIAYGMLLFLFSIGLSVTLGLMRFINLAHGAFAMCGGYIAVVLLNQFGVPYVLTLIPAFILTALLGIGAERTVIRHLYRRSELQQVLFSIGLAFAAGAVADDRGGVLRRCRRGACCAAGRARRRDGAGLARWPR